MNLDWTRLLFSAFVQKSASRRGAVHILAGNMRGNGLWCTFWENAKLVFPLLRGAGFCKSVLLASAPRSFLIEMLLGSLLCFCCCLFRVTFAASASVELASPSWPAALWELGQEPAIVVVLPQCRCGRQCLYQATSFRPQQVPAMHSSLHVWSMCFPQAGSNRARSLAQ